MKGLVFLLSFFLLPVALFTVALFTVGCVVNRGVKKTLTSSARNLHVERWESSGTTSGGRWSVQKRTLHGGKQEGVDLIEVDNGRLRFSVIPTRGMSILRVECDGVTLGWDSPVKEIVHPAYMDLASRAGLGWLDGFNEWMVRCGLEFAGHPGEDEGFFLTLHGRIGNIPASEVEVVVDREPPHRIRVRGRVDEKTFKFADYEIWTEISTVPGSNSFQIDDVVTNHSLYEREFQIIYHSNYGSPLLEKGSVFVAPVKRVTPFNDDAGKDMATGPLPNPPRPWQGRTPR